MKIFFPILIVAMALFVSSCEKDNFQEVTGLCPTVVSTNPAANATQVPLDQVISAKFNVGLRPGTITALSFTLNGGAPISGTVTYSDSTAYFIPIVNLAPFTTYTATLTTDIHEITGNALQTDYVWSFTTGAPGINLNSVARFGILAGAGISSSGLSEVHNLDIGVSPGLRSSISGFPPGLLFNGVIYASDDVLPANVTAMLIQAQQDLTQAYFFAANAVAPSGNSLSGDLGGRTLDAGIYTSTSSLTIQSGNLTLDAQGDPNAFWIIKVASDLTSIGGAGGNVVLTGGAQAGNVYWQIVNNATIGTGTSFKGNVLATGTIRMNSDATVEGRLLSRNGVVILINANTIYKP